MKWNSCGAGKTTENEKHINIWMCLARSLTVWTNCMQISKFTGHNYQFDIILQSSYTLNPITFVMIFETITNYRSTEKLIQNRMCLYFISTLQAVFRKVLRVKLRRHQESILVSPLGIDPITFCLWSGSDTAMSYHDDSCVFHTVQLKLTVVKFNHNKLVINYCIL